MLADQLRVLRRRAVFQRFGAFYGKAMAILPISASSDPAFLNRGQGWVARKLREILPRVRDNRLHKELAEMLASHEANIALANEVAGHTR